MKSSLAKLRKNIVGRPQSHRFGVHQSQASHTYIFTPRNKTILLVFSLLIVAISIIFLSQRFLLNPSYADTFTYPHGPVEEATISLTKPDDVTIDITPTPNGDNIGVSPNSTSVTTNSIKGYTLTLSTTSPTDNSLKHLSIDGYSISALANANSNLIASSWGFSTADPSSSPTTSLFNAVPTSSTPTTLKTTTESNTSTPDTTTVYYGAKVSYDVNVAGTYGNTVVYTAITELADAPTITNVSPNTGSTAGGDTITITGTNFDSIVNIQLGNTTDGYNDCTNIQITSATTATCTTPAGTAGVKDVVVIGQGGSATLANGFTYELPGPQVTSISPNSGHFHGGETVTITGTNFTGATNVSLGTSACRSFIVDSDTQITCVTTGYGVDLDGQATQAVSVNVTSALGTSPANLLFTYRYPTTSFLSGDTYTHVLGTDIEFGSKIQVGGTNCTNLLISSNTTAACNSPSSTAGTKTLSITAPEASVGNMQNFSETCTALKVGTTRVLTDTRDGQKYRVRCMADTKWWMIDNLKLAGGTTLNASNTNLNNTTDSAFISAWAGLSSQSTATSTATPTWIDPADSTKNTSLYTNCQPGSPGVSVDSLTGCGYLYNWFAATAGTGTAAMTTGDATSSICPVGWHLPSAGAGTATSTNEFAVLHATMDGSSTPSITSSATSRNNWLSTGPFEGTYAGYWAGSFGNQGYDGYYWSSSALSASNARSLYFSYNIVSPGSHLVAKSNGYSIKCTL